MKRKPGDRISNVIKGKDIIFGIKDGFRIETESDRKVVLYGVSSVSEYSRECVELLAKKRKITIYGESLVCTSYFEGVINVTGVISSVHFI